MIRELSHLGWVATAVAAAVVAPAAAGVFAAVSLLAMGVLLWTATAGAGGFVEPAAPSGLALGYAWARNVSASVARMNRAFSGLSAAMVASGGEQP